MKNEYQICVTDFLEKVFTIEAESPEEALNLFYKKFREDKISYVPSDDDYTGRRISVLDHEEYYVDEE